MKLNEHAGKLLHLLKASGIDAVPVTHEAGEILLFFETGDNFLIHVDPRNPTIWLTGVHKTGKTTTSTSSET